MLAFKLWGYVAKCLTEGVRAQQGESLGVIDIWGSVLIRWVNVCKVRVRQGTFYYTDMRPTYPSVHIEPIQMHKFPLFWKIIGINWEGEDFGLGILSRLNSDVSLAQSIIASSNYFDTNGLEIRAYPIRNNCANALGVGDALELLPNHSWTLACQSQQLPWV